MDLTLGELTESIGGRLTDAAAANRRVKSIRSLAAAGPEDVAFYKGDPRYLGAAKTTKACAIISDVVLEGVSCPHVIVEDAAMTVSFLLGAERDLQNPPPVAGIHPTAVIDPTAKLGADGYVGPHAVIEARAQIGARSRIGANAFVGTNAVLGEECVLHPGATVLHSCRLGNRVVLWTGAVVGRDGFGFLQRDGKHLRIPQVGGVEIGDDVEIGCWSSVDRGAVDPTIVEEGAKIDSHCHVAHNCKVGAHAILVGYARLAGSATIGKHAILAQDSKVGERRSVGDGAVVASEASVRYEDVPAGATVLGNPARPFTHQKRIDVLTDKLPDMHSDVRDLKKRVTKLEGPK